MKHLLCVSAIAIACFASAGSLLLAIGPPAAVHVNNPQAQGARGPGAGGRPPARFRSHKSGRRVPAFRWVRARRHPRSPQPPSAAQGPIVTAFGPEIFERERGRPERQRRTFSVSQTLKPPYVARIQSGDEDGLRKVTTAWVWINGRVAASPFDFIGNRRSFERHVELRSGENVVEVMLSGASRAQLQLQVTGHLAPDDLIEAATFAVDASGGLLVLPGIASVQIPAGTLSSADVEVSAVDSPYMKHLAGELDPSVSLLDHPAIRVKSSKSPQARMELEVDVPTLDPQQMEGRELTFLVLGQSAGAHGESIDELDRIGAFPCGADKACAVLSPDWFLPVNPADPEDPVIQVALATVPAAAPSSFYVWKLSNVAPASATAAELGDIEFRASLSLETNIVFQSPLDPGFTPYAPCPHSLPFNLCAVSGFYRTDMVPIGHEALDLRTQEDEEDAAGERHVFPLMAGRIGASGCIEPNEAGCRIRMQHDADFGAMAWAGAPGLSTAYFHLKDPQKGGILPPEGLPFAWPADEAMALSGMTGLNKNAPGVGPHLHVETWLDGYRIDTEPLLTGQLERFLQPRPSAPFVLPFIGLYVTSSQGEAKRSIAFIGNDSLQIDYTGVLAQSDVASLCPLAGDCSLVVTLQLVAERLGGHRNLATWTVDIVNQSPVINALAATPSTIEPSGQSTVSVVAAHPANEPLAYAWSTSCGTLSAIDGPEDKVFVAPATPGVCRVTVTVSDPSGDSDTQSVDVVVEQPASATIVHLDARLVGNYVSGSTVVVSLPAGTYTITPIGIAEGGQWDSWSAWPGNVCSDCRFQSSFELTVPALGISGLNFWDGVFYDTASQALAHRRVATFTLTQTADVQLSLNDCCLSDNRGGQSLAIVRAP